MPELPEVETVKQKLQKYLVGHKIEKIDSHYRNFEGDIKLITGAHFKDVRRFGKVLSLDLDNDYSIVIHIKLTGQLLYRGPNLKEVQILSKKVVGGVPGPHTHVTFILDGSGFLYYNDIRRFGWIKIIKTGDVEKTGFVGKLGPEPFHDLTLVYFQSMLSKTSRAIKVVLMDQEKIGGIGNIYVTDALWLSKINPKKPAKELDGLKIKGLYEAIHTVLRAGLKYGGASELAFVTPDGAEGQYQNHTLAYGHQGELCKGCNKNKLEKYFLSGRGTYWCPACQV